MGTQGYDPTRGEQRRLPIEHAHVPESRRLKGTEKVSHDGDLL